MNFCETCGQVLPGPVYELGRLRIFVAFETALLDGFPVPLSHTEFTILSVLGRRPGMPFLLDTLIEQLGRARAEWPEDSIKTTISKLRKKLRGTGVAIPDGRSSRGQRTYCLIIDDHNR